MEKEKITIKKTEIETTQDGIKVVRVTLQKGSAKYIRGARYMDLEDPKKRKSIYRSWKKDIDKIEHETAITEAEAEANIKTIIGEELVEEDE